MSGRRTAWLGVVLLLSLAATALAIGAAALTAREPGTGPAVVVDFPFSGEGGGGWSGLDVSPDGTRFWAVSDRGLRTEGTVLRDARGRLTGLDAIAPVRLPGLLSDRIWETPDAEGIDIRPSDTEVHISFEGFARVRRYDPTWHRAGWVPDIPGGRYLGENRGFEALARDAEGSLYTLPERMRGPRQDRFPLFRLPYGPEGLGDTWTLATFLSFDAGWLAVGADFGPSGAFYLLERRFQGIGFRSRIRQFDLSAAGPQDRLEGQIVFRSALGQFGNLEGLAIWADAEGQLRALMISDDNERSFQRSEVVEVMLGRLSLAEGAEGE